MGIEYFPEFIIKPIVEQSLFEDLGYKGDITSKSIIPTKQNVELQIIAREQGILAGMQLAQLTFQIIDPKINFLNVKRDGDLIKTGDILATVKGNTINILTAERCALNFLTFLSGVATKTNQMVQLVKPYPSKITCSRKTLPGLRQLQKYAVKIGGGINHRMGLYDAIMIKDNHIACAGGIKSAIQQAKNKSPHLTPIEVEVDNLDQLKEILELEQTIDMILLDNMDTDTLTVAVELTNKKIKLEASGGINEQNINKVASTGVDFIALGCITHSFSSLDIGLDYLT